MATLHQPTTHGLTLSAYSALLGDKVHLAFRRDGAGMFEDAFAVLSIAEARDAAAALIAAADEAEAQRAQLVAREATAAAAEQVPA